MASRSPGLEADDILARNRIELEERASLVRHLLPIALPSNPVPSPHVWLELPAPWTKEELMAWGRNEGILTLGAEAFSVDRTTNDQAIRISTSASRTRQILTEAVGCIVEALAAGPGPTEPIA